MITGQVLANQRSVGVVLHPDARTGQLVAAGTTFHVGNNVFLTAASTLPESLQPGAKLLVWLSWTQPNAREAMIEHRAAGDDIAILRVSGDVSTALPALPGSSSDEPVGRHVFAYGFIDPQCRLENGAFVTTAVPRASVGIIGSRYMSHGTLVYEVDFPTYPGEAGAPLFRVADNVVIGVVRGSRSIKTPEGVVRGPTLVAPLTPRTAPARSLIPG